jgi:hypothetical protein
VWHWTLKDEGVRQTLLNTFIGKCIGLCGISAGKGIGRRSFSAFYIVKVYTYVQYAALQQIGSLSLHSVHNPDFIYHAHHSSIINNVYQTSHHPMAVTTQQKQMGISCHRCEAKSSIKRQKSIVNVHDPIVPGPIMSGLGVSYYIII